MERNVAYPDWPDTVCDYCTGTGQVYAQNRAPIHVHELPDGSFHAWSARSVGSRQPEEETVDTTLTEEERERALARHMEMKLDLGHGVRAEFTGLYGDQENTRTGLFISHMHEDGMECVGSVNFDLPVMREKFPNGPFWTLHSFDPLTISPSVLRRPCGLHGFIRDGKWVPA